MAPSHAEPAQAEERKKQHLPPKSYADAAEKSPPPAGELNDNNQDANNLKSKANGANGVTKNSEKHTETHAAVSVLRITDNGAPEINNEVKEKAKEEKRPERDRQELKHRKPVSHKSSESGGKNELKAPSNNKSDQSTAAKTETRTVQIDENTAFQEKKKGAGSDKELASGKPHPHYEKPLEKDQKNGKIQRPLVSGRKAGQGWERSGIRFAPLNVPLQRRLQTSMVLFHTLTIGLIVSSFFFLCAIPLFWPLLIPYLIYCLMSKASTSGTLSYRLEFMRSSSVWSLFASYFPARLHRTQELPATRKYIFGYHPHGIISHGAFAAFATEALGFSQLFPGIKNSLLTLDSNFKIPLYREYALGMGLASVSKTSCENLLTRGGPNNDGMGRAITIVIGGARESLDAQPFSLRLVLQRRKGFVKLAFRTGADLVPILAFGENDLYDQLRQEEHPKVHKFQLLLKKTLGFTIPLIHARGVFNYDVGLMPYRRPLNIVVGKPIMVVQSSEPKQEEIDRVHEEYVKELERIWNTWKDEFAPHREEELEYIE